MKKILLNKQIQPYILLLSYGLLLIALIWKPGNLFISTTDYAAQHFAFADYFRKLFYDTKDLFPDFANAIGGGQNIYNFSYYGLFRPDVLISYLLPWIPAYTILTLYSIFLYLFGGCLIYKWISNNNLPTGISILMGCMFLSSSVLFQTHRQIMFVNHIPFFILSLLGVDKYLKEKKTGILVSGIFLMIMHSYYFSVTGILICCIYYIYRYHHKYKTCSTITSYFHGENAIQKAFLWIFTPIMLSAFFLLPTALSMLENIRESQNNIEAFQLLDFNFFCNTIIHDYYGCGFSFFIWLTLCIGLTMKRTRTMSSCCILSLLLPIVPYILNGTLYTHRKVYITFIPVILYLCAKILHLKLQKTKSDEKHYLLVALVPFVPVLCGSTNQWLLLDAFITLIILFFAQKKGKIIYTTIIISSIVCLSLNDKESFLSYEDYNTFYNNDNIDSLANNDNYRFASLQDGVYKSNYVANSDLLQTCVYSSIQNKEFQSFMNETMHLSTTSRNNMVHTNSSNIFFQLFTGTKLLHSQSTIPAGYNSTGTDDIYTNNDVLPIAYGTSSLVKYEDFNKLEYPYTLDTLVNTAVVPISKSSTIYKSKINKEILSEIATFPESTKQVSFNINDKKISVNSTSTTTFTIPLNSEADIIIFSAKLDSNDSVEDISVKINGIKEKLSGTTAPYNNNNIYFEYVISSNNPVKTLNLSCSPGVYTLNDIQIFTCDYDDINKYSNYVTPIKLHKCNGKEIINGTLSMDKDGYFITSIPYQKGLTATIDGSPVTIEKVNTAFAGFPITEGTHNITLTFHAPGKRLGTMLSVFGLLICFATYII